MENEKTVGSGAATRRDLLRTAGVVGLGALGVGALGGIRSAEAASYGDAVTLQTATSTEATQTETLLENIKEALSYNHSRVGGVLTDFQGLGSPVTGDILHARGIAFSHIGMADAAITDLNALVSQSPWDTPMHLNKLAQQLVRRQDAGDLADAKTIAASVAADPGASSDEQWFAYFLEAQAHYLNGDYTDAVTSADNATAIKTDSRVDVLKTLAQSSGTVTSSTTQENLADDGDFPVQVHTPYSDSERTGISFFMVNLLDRGF